MYKKVDTKLDFAARETDVVKFWKETEVVKKMIEKNKGGEPYTFYEGPPTANGKPHIGHVLTRTIKDVFLRYNTMKGKDILRKAGWDTHGLPVELEVEKIIGSTGKQDIEKYGIEPFIKLCRESVWKYKDMWEQFSDRMGYTVDTDDAYVTYTNSYIESEWWSLAEMNKKGLVYKGYRIVPYCPRCATSLSSHEVAQGYQDVKDRTVFVKFKALDEENTYYLAWTTTPWTLPSNVALCMNPVENYSKIKVGDENYIMANALIGSLFEDGTYEVVYTKKGKEFEKRFYEPLFDFVKNKYEGKAWFVTNADYVTLTDGTGVVHIAPAFGEDDSNVGKAYNLPFVQLVDDNGNMSKETGIFAGHFVKDADSLVIEDLKNSGKLLKEMPHVHSYPFCWRCKTPLIYYARSSWFVKTTALKDLLIENNAKVDWHPATIGEGRMGGFLRSLIDWDIARNRYWGTPLPFWVCECGNIHVVGSSAELKKLGGLDESVELDLHKPYVDNITFPCEKCGKTMHRTPEVLDCWYDSGSMPFAQLHYPFENKDVFDRYFPAEFISEGMDQTRGWFYSMLAVNTLLFGKAPYKRCLPLGLVNDKFGKKMSKSLGNVVTPWEVFDTAGSDAARWYFYISNAPWISTNFNMETLEDFERKFMGTLWNTYAFYILYAEIDQFDGSKHSIYNTKLSLMDKWIVSEFNKLVSRVDAFLADYVTTEPARLINDFVDSLSNWYVRRSRERFWAHGETEDKTAAFTTLNYVLVGLSKLAAPFVPAITEQIYQNVVRSVDKDAPVSVHLCDYPVADESLIDEELNRGMEEVLEIVVLGRSARNASGIKNRQPLSKIIVGAAEKMNLSTELVELIKDELNIQEVEFKHDTKEYLNYELKPQLKILGPKYGSKLGLIRNYLTSCDANEVVETVNRGETVKFDADGTNIELSKEDLLISPISKEGFTADSNGKVTVVLSTELTKELENLGLVREFISKVQQTRKDTGFEVTDHILIEAKADGETEKVLEEYAEMIKHDTLADSFKLCEDETMIEIDLNGENVKLKITKA
ncbi:MAG: isoleucine--tRNA ligase [Clostridia bacterium]|nr:isoleucine--tRNA ligase [Clostridia bacterium]